MSWALFVDSSNSISFDPEWDLTEPGEKIESQHRAKSGNLYRYTWGSFDEFTFSMKFVSSSDAAIVNSWWTSNTELLFMDEATTQVYSVQLMNKKKPITKRIMPYDDQFQGKIKLGTY